MNSIIVICHEFFFDEVMWWDNDVDVGGVGGVVVIMMITYIDIFHNNSTSV